MRWAKGSSVLRRTDGEASPALLVGVAGGKTVMARAWGGGLGGDWYGRAVWRYDAGLHADADDGFT